MAEEKEKKSASQSARDAAGSIKDAAKLTKDIGRIFAGDMSAIKDVLMNKLFWEIVLVIALIISAVGMIIGASITGVLQFLATSWTEHWDENRIDQAIQSNGDMTYFKTAGWIFTLTDTFKDVVKDTFSALTKAGIAAANGRDNSNLTDQEAISKGKNPKEDDYENTMQAILKDDPEKGIGLTPALQQRLEMIQGRVEQRGIQLKNAAYNQYVTSRRSDYHDLADLLSEEMEKKMEDNENNKVVLYAGFNDDLSYENFVFDMSAFRLSKLQALKILAIFSIQHDCQLTEMDIWSLMEYCGWFDSKKTENLDDISDSIYDQVLQDQRYGNDIGSVTEKNLGVPVAAFEMKPLQVPYWSGSCAPQWYYEQQALIREHNRQYLAYWEAGNIPEGMIPWGIEQPQQGSNTYTIASTYASAPKSEYDPFFKVTIETSYTFEIVQIGTAKKTFITEYVPNQNIVVTGLEYGYSYLVYRNTYSQTFANNGQSTRKELVDTLSIGQFTLGQAHTEDTIDTALNLSQFDLLSDFETYGIVDKLYYSAENNLTVLRNEYSSTEEWSKEEIQALGRKIYKHWEKYVWAREKNDGGGVVRRDDNGNHSYSYNGSIPSATGYYSGKDQYGNPLRYVYTSYTLALYDNSGRLVESKSRGQSLVFNNLSGDTKYKVKLRSHTSVTTYTYTYDEEGNVLSRTHSQSNSNSSSHKGTFTTFPDKLDTQAYEMYAALNLSFKARTVDEIAFELLGVWPGRLDDTVQVVRTTKENNLVGVNQEGQYSYCLREGNLTGLTAHIGADFNKMGDDVARFLLQLLRDLPLLRSRTMSKSEDLPLTVVTWKIEYGLNKSNPISDPSSSLNTREQWRSVEADKGRLVFDIEKDATYYVYCRITEKTQVLYSDNTTSESTKQYLFTIDVIAPIGRGFGSEYYKDTDVENGALYADGHLGNDKMLLNWQDIYTAPDGTEHTLDFTRMAGYQYESYVDMVMALCELLEIDYNNWDPAVKRAKEIGWNIE